MDEELQSAESEREAVGGVRKPVKNRFFDYSFASMAIYGSLTVMALVVAMENHPPTALRAAAQLFGITLAIAVTKAYAELIADTLDRERRLNYACGFGFA